MTYFLLTEVFRQYRGYEQIETFFSFLKSSKDKTAGLALV